MFKDEYSRHQEAVHAEEALIRRTLNAATRQKAQPRSWKPALIAALCVLVVAVPVALKLANTDDFAPLDAPPTPTVTPAFVSHEGTFQLQHISSSIVGETSYILLAAEGSGVSEKLTLDVQWTINDGETIWAQTLTPIEYSVNPPRATYLLTADCAQEGLTTSDHLPLALGDSVTMTLMRWWHATEDGSAPDVTRDGETTLHFNMGGVGEKRVSGGIVYSVKADGTARLENWLYPSTYAEVPAKVDGYQVTELGQIFYDNKELTRVVLPAGLTEITPYAFAGCTSLESVVLPKNLKVIGDYAFLSCSALEQIDLPDGLTSIGYAAFNASGLTSIDLPASIARIGNSAFGFCSLERITIEEGASCTIESWAFSPRLRPLTATIPASVSDIDQTAFDYSRYDTTIVTAANSSAERLALVLGYDVQYTGDSPVHQRSGDYQYRILPDGSAYLEAYFGGPEGIVPAELDGHPVSDLGACFSGSEITSVTLPEGLEVITPLAFYECYALKQVVLPDSLRCIDCDAFFRCISLDTLVIPAGVTEIAPAAFWRPSAFSTPDGYIAVEPITLIVSPGSYAETYARENNLPYQLVEAE